MDKEIKEQFENIIKELEKNFTDLLNKNNDSEEKKTNKKNDTKDDKKNNNDKNVLDQLKLIFNQLESKIREMENDKMLAVADKQNVIRRFQQEELKIKKYGGEKLASEIVTPIDTFRKVLQSTPNNDEVKNYLIGFEMIINQIDQALNNSGISVIEPKIGDEFNPELHTAIEKIATDKTDSGKICAIISNGYKLHDRVIKHASVKVAE